MMAPAAAALEGQSVLVVEDEALLAMELVDILERQGCKVVGPAANVAQALALLNGGRPLGAALLDLNLNGEPGLPVAAALSDRGVPFVVVSGYSEVQSSAPALLPAPRLTKPVQARDLVRVLSRMLAPPSD